MLNRSTRASRYLLVFLASVAVALLSAQRAVLAAEAVVAVSPAASTVQAGDQFTLDYTVGDVSDMPGIGGYVLYVAWNSAVLEMVSIADAKFVTEGNNIVLCAPPRIDNLAGTALLACAALPIFTGPGVAATQPTAFARSVFRAKAAGVTSVSLQGSLLEGPLKEAIAATLVGGTVTVTGGPADASPTTEPKSPTPASSPTPALTQVAATVEPTSTKAAQGALSIVEAPLAGSGDLENGGVAWWLLAAIAGGVALIGLGGAGAYCWRISRGRLSR